jgi:hypothetical protein
LRSPALKWFDADREYSQHNRDQGQNTRAKTTLCSSRGGLSSDKSTGLRSLRQTCGRFSVRGPAAWRVDGGTGKKITTSIMECKGLRNRLCVIVGDHNVGLRKLPTWLGYFAGTGLSKM